MLRIATLSAQTFHYPVKKVSIVIPVFNTKPQELDECLGACFRQGLCDDELEIILIDDGSSKPPQDIYEKYLSAHKNIILLKQKNAGVSATRNRGIEITSAEYLCFVDADDYLHDGVLAHAFQVAKSDNLDIAYYNAYPKETPEPCNGKSFLVKYSFKSGAYHFLTKTDFLKRSAIRFYEGKLCEDSVFAYELVSAAKRVKVVSIGGYFYRLSENSAQRTHDLTRKMKFAKDGVFFAANFLNSRLKNLKVGGGYYLLTLRIRNYYLLILLFRLLDSDLPDEFVSDILDGMQRDGLFPFSRENLVRSAKFKVMHVSLNGRLRFAFFRKLLKNKFFFALAVAVSGARSYKFKNPKIQGVGVA